MNEITQGVVATAPSTPSAIGTSGLNIQTLGFRRQMIPPPENMVAVVLGKPNSGKTSFLASCDEALIINLDGSSTPGVNQPRAMFWPGMNSEGELVIPDPANPDDPDKGEAVTLTWELVKAMESYLHHLAKEGLPRPRMIAIDSIARAIDLAQDYVVRYAQELSIAREPVTHFNQLNGKAAWDVTYREVVDMIKRLKNSGYGVYLVVHLCDKTGNGTDGSMVTLTDQPSITNSVQGRIWPMCEMIAKFSKRSSVKNVQVQAKDTKGNLLTTADGKPKMVKRQQQSTDHVMSFTSGGAGDVTKTRRNLSEVVFDSDGTQFDQFTTAYNASFSQENL